MTKPAALPATFRASPENAGEAFIGYIRVSTWKEEKISPELQRTAIEDWARRTGARIIDWIIDLDATGRNFKRKIMRGIEKVERGDAAGVAVWKYSRFGRDRTGNAINLARLEQIGGRLESATEQIDATTAIGRFQRGMILELSAFESDRAGEQWTETHEHRRANGLPSTGRRRFGYVWHQRWNPRTETLQKERYEPDPKLAPIIEDLYARKIGANGPVQGFAALAGRLNNLGHLTSRGNAWTANSVQRYMDTGFAAGLLRLHAPDCKHKSLSKCRNYLYAEAAHDGIITPELWEKYLEHRESTKTTPPRARNPIYPLSGLLRCGECRYCLAACRGGSTGKTVNGYGYRCNHQVQTRSTQCKGVRMTRAKAEREVHQWLADNAAAGIDAAPSVPQQRVDVETERVVAARERARLQADLDKYSAGLARLQADRAVNPDDYPPGAYEAARERIALQQATAQAALEKVAAVEQTPDRADYVPLIANLLEAWDLMNVSEMNSLLRQVVRRVVGYRVERDGKRPTSRIEVHPAWEPDPWAEPLPTE
ncbi:recombinase family protein [Streptomyces sp. NBC_00264]|uniref:recombinase family protein n=1 Tax=unclassified Streptomyces TaxID=2593676 RepID=UPI002250EB2B|nr:MULTISPECIES: recombinase family protein [unclassified Streptomyces]MCX5161914.1 recombinase family protein [Streptomyces sp. NBC_00305]MCX5220431.1 recombinase family protein [Streptomyces sp. NBC_00264]